MAIRLNKQTEEKEAIKQLIKQSILNPKYELECIVGSNYNLGSTITIQQFNKIISRVNGKAEYIVKRPEDKLMISFPRDSRYKNMRVSVNGFTAINYYCNNNKLDNILTNVTIETKEFVKEKLDKVIVPEYSLKFNQKAESTMDKDVAIVKDMLRDWKDLPKVFRYKTTYHFVSIDGNFSLDCSIVRSSSHGNREITVAEAIEGELVKNVIQPPDEKMPFMDWWKRISKVPTAKVMVREVGIYFKNVKESKVFDNNLLYEVEVEFIGNKVLISGPENGGGYKLRQEYTDDKDTCVNYIFANMFKHIGVVLQSVQDSFYIMSNSEVLKTIAGYSRLTGKSRTDRQLFFGPLPIDLDKNKCIRLPDNAYNDMIRVYDAGNILIDYCVTDKSDGVRNLLYIDDEGNCYLIGRDSISLLKNVGIKIPGWANSIFDGEYLEYDVGGEYLNKYMMFDAYYVKGKNIMTTEFGDGKTNMDASRYGAIVALATQVSTGNGVQLISDKLPFRLDKKNFLFGELSTTPVDKRNYNLIFQQSAKLLDKMNVEFGGKLAEGNLYSYKTDGLIFTPVRLGIYQNNPAMEQTKYELLTSRKWEQCYKWKPSQFLTIDFKCTLLKDMQTGDREYIYYSSKKYIRAELKSMNYPANKYKTKLNALLLNDGMSLEKMPLELPFMASYPYLGVTDVDGNLITTTSQCLLEVNERGEIFTEENEQILDGDTVEFRYISPTAKETMAHDHEISIQNDAMRWRPLRLRRGKVANALNVALDIWTLIHSPVTTKIISTGVLDADDSKDLNYYLGVNSVFLTDPVKKLNNYVKGYILEKYLTTQTKPRLLDLGCGKMGDFFKYVNCDISYLVGIDLNSENLNSPKDGAATRIFENIDKNHRVKQVADKTLLINGSFTDSLADGNAGVDMLAKYYLDILYGRHKPLNNAKHMKFYNLAVDGFNTVTSMYVIHYAFNTEQHLDTYLQNVSSSLKDQGYFIGTCLDGNAILDSLNTSPTRGIIEGKLDKTTVWMIENKSIVYDGQNTAVLYDKNMVQLKKTADTSSPHILGTGNKIKVYFETINTISEENLVDINYLEHKAKQYNLKLLESRTFIEEPGSMLTEFLSSPATGKTNPTDLVAKIRHEPALLEWTRFNRYFVFQKSSN